MRTQGRDTRPASQGRRSMRAQSSGTRPASQGRRCPCTDLSAGVLWQLTDALVPLELGRDALVPAQAVQGGTVPAKQGPWEGMRLQPACPSSNDRQHVRPAAAEAGEPPNATNPDAHAQPTKSPSMRPRLVDDNDRLQTYGSLYPPDLINPPAYYNIP